ncbi:type III PLP-dependent enzyme domain-containing protein [Azospirillum argentinense]
MAPRINRALLKEIAAEQGTPCFVFDLEHLKDVAGRIIAVQRASFPCGDLFYSFKTNSDKKIVSVLRELGYGAEVVSGRELKLALSHGFLPSKIIFNGPLKRRDELQLAIQEGVTIHVDSLDELRLIASLRPGPRARLGLRIATLKGSAPQSWSRFGLSRLELMDALQLIHREELLVRGLHLHAGSNLKSPELLALAIRDASTAAQAVVESSCAAPEWIDIGGGFPGPSAAHRSGPQTFRAYILAAKAALKTWPSSLNELPVFAEPGRILTEGAGYLLTQFVARKHRDPVDALVLDAGRNLIPSAGTHFHPIHWLRCCALTQRFAVYGRNCFESDLLCDWAAGPESPRPGDLLVIGNVGAYDWSTAFPWTDAPIPLVFLQARVANPSVTPSS